MTLYFCKKLFYLVISLFIVASMTFVLMKAIPGDPFSQEQAVPEEILKSLYRHYGLDRPYFIQYLKYLKGVFTLDFGPSFKYESQSVTQIIKSSFPVSFTLGLQALIFALFGGISLGTIAALFRGRTQDHIAMIIAVLGLSIPSYILATTLQYIFAMKLKILPVARWGSFSHTILPSLALASLPMAFIARLTRTNMVEILEQDYILTARAKGLSPIRIIMKHVLKNSLMPVITYLAPLSSSILTGSFVIEKIFGIPGLGGWFVNSIINRDYTVIMGVTIFYSVILMVSIFIVDLLYFILDPRLRERALYE
ncbi:MAG: ABC transporter permease [Simkaniaceae bacterium]